MSDLAKFIDAKRQNRLEAYRNEPKDIQEHAGIEETVLAGGYGYRQVLELVQNGADAILEALDSLSGTSRESRIEVILSDRNLYVANTGAPLSHDGVEALLHSHSSPKRGNQIGRFGLGFKSLLRLGGKLGIFSSSGSLRFDPERCQSEIREAFQLGGSTPVPGLRLAWALNREEEEATDPVLNGFPWATTIVRAEIRNADILPHLREEISRFPSPFLLFLPLAVTLNLDAGIGEKRRLRRESNGSDILLRDGDAISHWRVFERPEVRITDPEAKNDATHLHDREVVPLAWAMPLDGHREQGRFWAFFPTDTPTRLPGILNAPWKLNSDRKALIPGPWNTALMREAARLIAEHLPDLATVSDPGRPLDAFPRQLERQDEPAAPLVNAIWQAIKTASIIPDAQGKLRPATELQRPPLNNPELHEAWRELANQEAQARWVHATCLSERERCARLSDLSQRLPYSSSPRLDQATAEKWFLDIATADLLGAKAVLALVSTYAGKRESYTWNQERPKLAIIPSASGRLCTPDQVIVPPAGVLLPGRECVAPALVDDTESLRVLTEVLKVKQLDDAGWRGLLKQDFDSGKWPVLWETLRRAPIAVGDDFLKDRRDQIPVRRRDGSWVLHDQALLPGEIVAVDDPDENNRKVLVDEETHGEDQERLRAIGVGASPHGVRDPGRYAEVLGDSQSQSQFSAWLGFAETDYRNQLDANRNPQAGYLRPLSLSMPNGWMLLSRLRGLANSRLTSNLFETLTHMDDRVEFGHTTQGKHYRPTQVAHPMRWYLREHGTFAIGNHAIPLKTLLARRETKVLGQLDSWSSFKTRLDPLADLPGAPAPAQPTPAQLSAFWRALFDHFVTPEALAGDGLLTLWTEAARDEQVPESVPNASGPVSLAEIYVSGSGTLIQRARDQGKTAITLEAEALPLWLERGARHLDSLFRAEWAEAPDTPMPLATLAPELGEVLRNESETLSCPVHDLRLVIDGESQATPCLLWDGLLYLDPVQLERLTRVERLAAILREAGAAGWLNPSIDEAQNRIANAQLQTNRDRVAAGETLPDRLLLAVGGKVEALIGVLGENVRNILPPDCEPRKVAELALARRGPAILQDLKQTLKEEGLRPPDRWGGDEARAFVSSLGFPEDFAAAKESRREAEEYISGPIPLGVLHDYQEEVINGLRGLLQSGTGRRRAVVSLPTGGGKTRVTVQAAVDLILKSETCTRSVLWVAQTDELCEQAVQAFRQVWLNRGVDRMDLRIVRLWGGNLNPAAPPARQPTAVVASIQTLKNRVGRDDLAWLSQPGLVVVDECHHGIAPSYTGLLKWLDAEAPRPGSTPRDEPPIIGLSATPFRGSNDDEENRRLAKRFDGRWLPADQAALHEKLTHGGMLSIAEHEALKSPTALPDELVERMQQQADMDSIQFENFLDEINRMLADDEDRNRLLLDTIADSEEQSILFFTNSVRHAEEMADRLNLAGVSAHAVSGNTPASARRYFLERFQHGEARVLCNHSVLTTGFDAPKTDMVLIARQVSSPVLYMQMVGRGLRGKANGGTERCRIVTVEENLGKFRDRLPYDFCAKYFV